MSEFDELAGLFGRKSQDHTTANHAHRITTLERKTKALYRSLKILGRIVNSMPASRATEELKDLWELLNKEVSSAK